MKFSRNLLIVISISAAAIALTVTEQDVVTGSRLQAALYRRMALPYGAIVHPRPAWEAKKQLTEMLHSNGPEPSLYALRAQQEEKLQDYKSAEADWRTYAAKVGDKKEALADLASFYERRNQPAKQVDALAAAGNYSDAASTAQTAGLPTETEAKLYEQWIADNPKLEEPYRSYLSWLANRKDGKRAASVLVKMKAAFPDDVTMAIKGDVMLAEAQGDQDAALDVYRREFSPLWPADLRKSFYSELDTAHQLRTFLNEAERQAARNPADFQPVGRLFFYYEQRERKDFANRQLLEYEARTSHIEPAVWKQLAALFLRVPNHDEAARAYSKLYASGTEREFALAGLINVLLDAPEQQISFGNRDLSLYKNIGQMDRHPGFLNGILSVDLNSTAPDYQYQTASQAAVPYFHRAAAARLLDRFRGDFPHSAQTAALEAKLFSTYALYGENAVLIREIPAWMARNPGHPDFVDTAMLLADAYQRSKDEKDEFNLYDSLLTQLSERAHRIPLGQRSTAENKDKPAANSPGYQRVLARYVSRLSELDRRMDAVAVLRRQVDANPDDSGVYEQLALFLEQNKLEDDLEQTYRQAFDHFKDTSWASKLARLYLRQKRNSAYRALSEKITDTFRGSVVATFISQENSGSIPLARQILEYAHHRFPQNIKIVTDLLANYEYREDWNPEGAWQLIQQYWPYSEQLRTRFLGELSARGKLEETLAGLPPLDAAAKDSNLAALELRANGYAWECKYEEAEPAFAKLASLETGDRTRLADAISIERSMGALPKAVVFAEQDVKAAPADEEAIVRVGEIYMDGDDLTDARPWWNRVPSVHPNSTASYLNSATVFWDYFDFDDAQRVITEARTKFKNPDLFAFEAGAIFENKGDVPQAVDSYVAAVLHDGSAQSEHRLLQLSRRRATAALVEEKTRNLTGGSFNSKAFDLRLAVLGTRDAEIRSFLTTSLAKAETPSDVEQVRAAAAQRNLDAITADAMRKLIGITADAIEKLQPQINLAHFEAAHNDAAGAGKIFDETLAANPNSLGVIRSAVDFYWEQKNFKRAVSILTDAANRAQPPYIVDFRREAAQKAANSGDYQTARALLDQLLAPDPWNGDLLAQKAETYAREGDQQQLAAFYAAELERFKQSPFGGDERRDRIGALRRGYIGALIAIGNNHDAMEQYQLLINGYPEDTALITEATRFAENHQLATAMIAYYEKATSDSPRDYRWPLVLGRIHTVLRKYPEAIAAYQKAAYVRPDRPDIFQATAELQTRLLRFEDAIKSYQRLYEASYHDPQYLEAQALMQQRLHRPDEALRLLRQAYIDPKPSEPSGYVAVMQKEYEWKNFAAVDDTFKGLRSLLAHGSYARNTALELEAGALISMHRVQDALALAADTTDPQTKLSPASSGFGYEPLSYLTPEDKRALSAALLHNPRGIAANTVAQAARLSDVEAELAYRDVFVRDQRNFFELDRVQRRRLEFVALGKELEQVGTPGAMQHAFSAYRDGGDIQDEMRLMDYAGADLPELMIRSGVDLEPKAAALGPERRDTVVSYAILNGPPKVLRPLIDSERRTRGVQWTDAYTALAGLYWKQLWAGPFFDALMGPRTIGAELADKSKIPLRGEEWFYYAGRYADYLAYQKHAEAANALIPAAAESSAAASDNYVQMAESYADANEYKLAVEAYNDALELSPNRIDVYNRLAQLAIAQKRRTDAVADWRNAIRLMTDLVEEGPLPESYFSNVTDVLHSLNKNRAFDELRPQLDAWFRVYARRNGTYNAAQMFAGFVKDSPNPDEAVRWLVELDRNPDAQGLVDQLMYSEIPDEYKEPIYRSEIARAKPEELVRYQVLFANWLEAQKRFEEEYNLLVSMDPRQRPSESFIIASGITGHLDQLLSAYTSKADTGSDVLQAAGKLDELEKHSESVRLRDFEYTREIRDGSTSASAWFGLAEVRFDQKRDNDGLQLIRDASLSIGEPFEQHPEAVRLLEKWGKKAEALNYAKEWSAAKPWDDQAQLTVARLSGSKDSLTALVKSEALAYSTRVAAAKLLRAQGAELSGSDELALLTHKSLTVQQASPVYYTEAKLAVTDGREQALFAAIAEQASLEEPRLDLAELLADEGKNRLAISVFQTHSDSSSERQAVVGEKIARIYLEQGQASAALALLNTARPSAQIQAEIAQANGILSRHAANAKRAPKVSDELKQANVVRPRFDVAGGEE